MKVIRWKNIFFDKFLKPIKLVNKPSQCENKNLNFANQLIGQIYLFNIWLDVIFIILIQTINQIFFFLLLSKIILERPWPLLIIFNNLEPVSRFNIIFFQQSIFQISLINLLSKYPANDKNWMGSLINEMLLEKLQNFELDICQIPPDCPRVNFKSMIIKTLLFGRIMGAN